MSPNSLKSLSTTFHHSLPPKVRGLPIVGSMPAFVSRPFDFLLQAQAQYGDIYTLDLGILHWVVLNHPRHAEHIFRDYVEKYPKEGPTWRFFRTLAGNSMSLSSGDTWLRKRRMMHPHFHRERLEGLTEVMVSAVQAGMHDCEQAATHEQLFEILPGFASITMQVMLRALFGQRLRRHELHAANQSIEYILDYVLLGMVLFSLPTWVPVRLSKRYYQAHNHLNQLVQYVVDQERRADTSSDSLLAMFVQMVDADTGEQMTPAELHDEVIAFFLAGYETTSLTMTWTIHLLTQHPQVMHKLQTEIDTVLGKRLPTFADLAALTYTRMVVQEAMRLRPPSWWIPRTLVADDEIDGYLLPAGTTVALLPYGIHHNPQIWENPTQFVPERFTPERQAQQHKLAWIPFGSGQRQCIGRDFALMEAQIILAMLIQRYTISALDNKIVSPQLTAMLKPAERIKVRLTKRHA